MSNTATRPKHLTGSERTAALAAIGTAQRKHEHVAIRPKRARAEGRHSEAVEVPRGTQVEKISTVRWKARRRRGRMTTSGR